MCVKKYLILHLKRMVYHLKSIGVLFFIPLAIVDIIIPTLNYLEYTKYGVGEYLYINILQYSQWFIPFFSVWWIIFVLREYIESDGNEVLYVHSDRSKLPDVLFLFIAYVLNIAILFSIYTVLLPHMKYEFYKILSICVFYLGMVYFLSFLTKSTTITLMAALLYALASITFISNESVFPFYYTLKQVTPSIYFATCFPLALTGLVLIFVGTILNKKALRFV